MPYKYKKSSSIRKYRPLIAVAGIVIIIIVVLVSVQKDMSQLSEDPSERALAIAEQNPDVQAFKEAYPDAMHGVLVLEPETAKEMANDYPVIYGDLPEKILYEVQYSAGETGMLLIIDVENSEVLKLFETAHQFL